MMPAESMNVVRQPRQSNAIHPDDILDFLREFLGIGVNGA